ncbi:hypothetical protein HNR23_002742 [Nocardiopsis mwathae]|uniref:DUF5753 domain-containing protein n=2 Tax=Nocardiopsis mwathae TaxID=1472723 RepID=A0A7X0D5Q1_9ACTN|nr:hypothetical protein [Nocardiopsis mwathae]
MSRQLIGAFEKGTRTPNGDQAERLDTELATGGALLFLWEEIRDTRGEPSWWRDVLIQERRARQILEYQPCLIPGMLQTPDYARTLISARQVHRTPEQVEEIVQRRTQRLDVVKGSRPLLWFIVEQPAVELVIGDESITKHQRKRIVELWEEGTIRFQVALPVAWPPGLCPPFRVMCLPDGRSIAHVESAVGGFIESNTERVEFLRTTYNMVQAEALSPSASIQFLEERI